MNPDPSRFRRVEEIFSRIVQLPRGQWTSELDEACAGDSDLRRELDSLLQHADPVSRNTHPTDALREFVPEILPDANIGRCIGPYEIRGRLGVGGMGNVYMAVQTEPVQRNVAIKLIRRGIDTEDTIQRFSRERQVLAALSHPSIVRLLDAGAADDGLPYFVMEPVEGEPITSYCNGRALSIAQRLRLFQQVCMAVHFAHQNTVIHRDLKPANILVTAEGRPKLLDFGIAKLVDPDPSGVPSATTRTQDRFLTQEYASPEQFRGKRVTTVSDLYSLGVVLYELLTGRLPYKVGNLPRDEAEQIICDGREPRRPSERASGQLRRQLVGDLDNIVLRALCRNPGGRYASAEQFSADIERYLQHEPVLAAAPGAMYRLGKFARRNRAACAVVAAVLLGGIGSAVGGFWAVRSRDAASRAEQTALRAEQAARQAEYDVRDHAERLRRAISVREVMLASLDFRAGMFASMKRRLQDVPPELREWEWRYLHALADDSLETWRGHEGEVCALAYSPDGRRVASGGADKTIRIWDSSNGTTLHVLRGHEDVVNSLSFSPDGRQVASGSSDGTLRLWDVQAGQQVATFKGDAGPIGSVRFSPVAAEIAAATRDHTITLRDARTGAVLRKLSGYEGRFDSLAWSPDGQMLAAGGSGNDVLIWDARNGIQLKALKESGPVASLAFSTDGQHLAIGVQGRPVLLRDTHQWRVIHRRKSPLATSLALSSDNRWIAFAVDAQPVVRLVSMLTAEPVYVYRGHDSNVRAVAFSPMEPCFVSTGADGLVKVWDGSPTNEPRWINGRMGQVACVAISPDSRVLVIGGQDGGLLLWDTELRWELRRLAAARGSAVTGVAFTPDGRLLVACTADGVTRVWDAMTAAELHTIAAHRGAARCVAAGPDSRQFISAGDDGILRIWDARTGKPLHEISGHVGPVRSAAFSPDCRWIASTGDDATVRLWNPAGGPCLRVLQGHTAEGRGVAFSLDARHLATASADGTLRLWAPATGEALCTMAGHKGAVLSVGFNADGRRMVSSGADHTVRVWDTESGREILILREHSAAVNCVLLSPDERMLISGGDDGKVWFQDAWSHADRLKLRRNLPVWNGWAGGRVDELRDRLGSWQEVAMRLRDQPMEPEASRRRALSQVLAHATTLPALAGDWEVAFFRVPPAAQPAALEQQWQAAAAGPALAKVRRRVIDYNWDFREPIQGLGAENYGLTAAASIEMAAGRYRFTLFSRDEARLWVDGRVVIDHWTPHEPASKSVELDLPQGRYAFRVDSHQGGGFARLGVYVEAIPSATTSSAAP